MNKTTVVLSIITKKGPRPTTKYLCMSHNWTSNWCYIKAGGKCPFCDLGLFSNRNDPMIMEVAQRLQNLQIGNDQEIILVRNNCGTINVITKRLCSMTI